MTQSVAVCIPAFDEVAGIAETVRSVWATGYPREFLTVVVAVDGGDARVRAAAEEAGAQVVVLTPNQGSYAARNAAIEHAGDVDAVLFTDADCVVAPRWIEAHLHALAGAPLSGGAVTFVFQGEPPTPAEWIDSLRHLRQEAYVTHDGFAATCNLAVRRAVFDRLRFDASLRSGGDADFCLRAKAAGFDLVYSPEASIAHPARRTRRELLHKVRRIAKGAAHVRRLQDRAEGPTARFTLGAYRAARAAGHKVGPIWGIRVSVLDYAAQRIRVNAARERQRAQPS